MPTMLSTLQHVNLPDLLTLKKNDNRTIAHQHVPRLELGGSAAVGLRRSVRQTCRSGKSISIGGTIAHDKQNQV